jgi:alkanesulfonate monooxygenase SsuD/methylene tetrahydromethanopterin reductase-like flavin-dependent oxidoreductase (luciferase family)
VDPVDVGIYLPQIGFEYAQIRDRAQSVEDLGFHSLWLFDHLYGPELPDRPSFEGWTLGTALLAETTRLRVGQLVLSNTLRHPALLAKMATTLDVISGGRLELGLGSGSYAPEHERAGIAWGSFRERSAQLGEALEIITAMFAAPSTTFAGEHYAVRDLPNLPPPVQRPRPPIHVGGAGERHTLPLVARYADVWNCPTYALGELAAKRAVLERECAVIGRDPGEIRISLEAVLVLGADRAGVADALALAERRFPGPGFGLHEGGFIGTPDEIVATMRAMAAEGVSLFVFFTHDRAAPETLGLLADEVLPAL